jgi:hypothetical protein
MATDKDAAPAQYKGVTVSSTYTDLEPHRRELMSALRKQKFFSIGMEDQNPIPGEDLISSSLKMVREGHAYIAIIGHRYGQVAECPVRNPNSYSITRLEFEEASHLQRPTLIFVMGDRHPVLRDDVERDPEKIKKLDAFRERAKEGRIYQVFDSLEDFTTKAIHAVAELRLMFEDQEVRPPAPPPVDLSATVQPVSQANEMPAPPALYAEPPYIGSHPFVGRASQLDTLSEWAEAADSRPVLLFEAIGGTGKSILTWEWTTKHSTQVRNDWAGRFWYSFYEKGAIMADFCQRALAYITGQPLEELRKKKTAELSVQLVRHLQARPWLLVLDGLERVLVAYHRVDAAQVADDRVDASNDQIVDRHPCAAIRPEDDDLLRALAAASPSKVLVTTRLTPRILLSSGGLPIPGVLRVLLPGLRPADAEELLRGCGVTGDSQRIQNYLKSHCDCHPLVTGVLAGLINHFLPDRGNFDAWERDPVSGGGHLNLADLDLVQKRNHILEAAVQALPEKSRQLLSILALLSEAVDVATLTALNPHVPPELDKVDEPQKPEDSFWWDEVPEAEREVERKYYEAAFLRWREYQESVKARQQAMPAATQELSKTVQDLEQRGLLQYDHQSKRYDLHPVVRGFAAGSLRQEDKERYGERVVDYFSQRAHIPYREAESIEDLCFGIWVVRVLLHMGRYREACAAYLGKLCNPLLFNLEAYAEVLAISRPFFPNGWGTLPDNIWESDATHLASDAAMALEATAQYDEALAANGAIILNALSNDDVSNIRNALVGVANVLTESNRLAKTERLIQFALELAALEDDVTELFRAQLDRFTLLTWLGRFAEAQELWDDISANQELETRLGHSAHCYALFHFDQGTLKEEHLAHAEERAKAGKSRSIIRSLYALRGEWYLQQEQWALAAENLGNAVQMARAVGQSDLNAEALLCLAKFYMGQLPDPRHEAERLASVKRPPHQDLARLWLALGERAEAKKHAVAAYEAAWADGEPYVYRYSLEQTRSLLEQLECDIPNLPPYDPDKDEKLPWEDQLAQALAKARAEADRETAH